MSFDVFECSGGRESGTFRLSGPTPRPLDGEVPKSDPAPSVAARPRGRRTERYSPIRTCSFTDRIVTPVPRCPVCDGLICEPVRDCFESIETY